MEKKSFLEVVKEPQNIIAIGVTIISMCALVVSVMQTQIMSEQRALMLQRSKAEVWPRLEMGFSKSHRKEDYKLTKFALGISNVGIGPAIITDVRLNYKEQQVTDWWDLFGKFEMAKEIETYINNIAINNSIIKIGEDVVFFDLSYNLPLAQEFYKHIEDMKIEVWYESVYGDKWKLTYQNRDGVTEEADPNFSLPDEEQFEN